MSDLPPEVDFSDFISGLVASLILDGVTSIPLGPATEEAVVVTAALFAADVDAVGGTCWFRLAVDPVHGGCGAVRQAWVAPHMQVIARVQPRDGVLVLDCSRSLARKILDTLPGDSAWYRDAADRLPLVAGPRTPDSGTVRA